MYRRLLLSHPPQALRPQRLAAARGQAGSHSGRFSPQNATNVTQTPSSSFRRSHRGGHAYGASSSAAPPHSSTPSSWACLLGQRRCASSAAAPAKAPDTDPTAPDAAIVAAAEANSGNTRLAHTADAIADAASLLRDKANILRASAANALRPDRDAMITTAMNEHRRARRRVAQATRMARRDVMRAREAIAYRDSLIVAMREAAEEAERDDAAHSAAVGQLRSIDEARALAAGAEAAASAANSTPTTAAANGAGSDKSISSGALSLTGGTATANGKKRKGAKRRALRLVRKEALLRSMLARIEAAKVSDAKGAGVGAGKAGLSTAKAAPTSEAGLQHVSSKADGSPLAHADVHAAAARRLQQQWERRAMHDPTDPNSLPPTRAATVAAVVGEAEEALEAAISHAASVMTDANEAIAARFATESDTSGGGPKVPKGKKG